jgi:DNA replication and repair protein RecF
MYLRKLSLTNFKNYQEANLEFSEKINCFVGNNGAGKTNLLDAIYYLSFTKSYFNTVDLQNIRHETDFFAIHGEYLRNGNPPDQLTCIQKRNQKKIFKLNKKEHERLADHIGLYPLVMVSPYDRDLINEGSELRRKFIDSVISQFDRVYLDDLIVYNKVLAQRNALLKQFSDERYFDAGMLDILNEQLTPPGYRLFEKRKTFLTDFAPIFTYYYGYITGEKEEVSISYESQLIQDDFEKQLQDSVERDKALRYTTVGIHKDDLEFLIDGFPLKKFGSQGQQKSYAIAVKLAQFEFTKKKVKFKPVLLFDDIFDKLDPSRVAHLIHLVSDDRFGQVFITDTQRERIQHIFDSADIAHKVFKVSEGVVSEILPDIEFPVNPEKA